MGRILVRIGCWRFFFFGKVVGESKGELGGVLGNGGLLEGTKEVGERIG